MAIPASQLEPWARYVESPSSKRTADSIRDALNDVRSVVRTRGRDIYLQGSYRNSTNLFRDSDVDVVIELTSTFYSGTTNLDSQELRRFESAYADSGYSLGEFREDVIQVLVNHYGANLVQPGNKAIRVLGNGQRLDADVLVCAQYRKWDWFEGARDSEHGYVPGIVFYTQDDNRKVINFPKVHYQNGHKKHEDTREWFKPTVRMFKSARNHLERRNLLPEGTAPSYFLECLLYNVADWRFGNDHPTSFKDVLDGLQAADLSKLLCQNKQLPLFGPTSEQWDEPLAERYIHQVRYLWDNWYSF